MKIFLADDHDLFRDALIQFIKNLYPDWDVDTGSNLDDAVLALTSTAYDLLLLDLRMPGMNRLEGLKKIKHDFPDQKTAIITGVAEEHHVREAIEIGAHAYLPKTLSGKALAQAINLIVKSDHIFIPMDESGTRIMPAYRDGFRAYPDQSTEQDSENSELNTLFEDLTKREKQVILLLAQGLSNKEIANDLGIQAATVKLHVGNICKKLHVSNRTQAAILVHQYGLVPKLTQ